MPFLKNSEDGVRLCVRVQPGAKSTAIVGLHGTELKIRIASPPVDGAANAALIQFLAKALDLRKAQIELVSGKTSRSKQVIVQGLSLAEVRRALVIP